MPDRCPKCLLPLATQDDYAREHPDECDVQAGTGDSCWCGRLCWEDESDCDGDRGEALNAAALRLARAADALSRHEDTAMDSQFWEPPLLDGWNARHDQVSAEYNAAVAAFRAVDAVDGAG